MNLWKIFSNLAKLLNELTRVNTLFVWNKAWLEAFQKLKTVLTSSPVLMSPDFSQPFVLHSDRAKTGLGAVLSQRDDQRQEYVVSYACHSNNKAERRGTRNRVDGHPLLALPLR